MVSGCGISSVTRVAPASSADSIPLPKPPTQKNGIGRYSRVSEVMQRAASPDRTAPNALPWECMTPLGAPLLPEVNMMTSGSAAVTVSVMASTIRAGPIGCSGAVEPVGRPNLAQGRKFGLPQPTRRSSR